MLWLGIAASNSVMRKTTRLASITYNLTSSKLHGHKIIRMMTWWWTNRSPDLYDRVVIFWYHPVSQMSCRPKIAILDLKMTILDLKMAMDLSKNILIWSTAKSCTVGSGIIHFDILFNNFMSPKCTKGPKMAILGLKMAILDLKMAMDHFKNIFIWSAAKSCTAVPGIINVGLCFLWLTD